MRLIAGRWLLPAAVVLAGVVNWAPGGASAAPYAAAYDQQCCYETIESGATERQFFEVTNAGTATWGQPGGPSINLGLDEPDVGPTAPSEFQAADWPFPSRPVVGVSHPVPPGGRYRFLFDVKAPPVSKPTTFTEHFGVLAEGVVWMNLAAGLGPDMWLVYNVVPAQPPGLQMSISGPTVQQGGTLTVHATATDVASISRVTLAFAGQQSVSAPPRNQEGAVDAQTTWSTDANFTTANLGAGPQTLVATAYNDAGLSTTQTAGVEVVSGVSAPPPAPSSAATQASVVPPFRAYLVASTVARHRHAIRVRRVVVIGTTAGEHLSLACRACQGRAHVSDLVARSAEAVITPGRLVMTPRSRLAVYASFPGRMGRFKEYAFSFARLTATAMRQGCLAEGNNTPTRCPT